MNGARFVHDRLELAGWQVEIADAQKVKGLAPLACKIDRIDLGAGRARAPGSGAGDLATRSARARRAGAGALAAAPGAPPLEAEAAGARCAAHARQALPGLGSVRPARPPAAREPRATGAVAADDRG